MRPIVILLFFLMFLDFSGDLTAAPRSRPHDALGQVKLLEQLLLEGGDRYRLIIVEPFENDRPWTTRAPSTELSDIRYLYKAPVGEAFRRESDLINRLQQTGSEQSLFVHTSFTDPGRQSYTILPSRKITVRGRLFRASLWVHSHMYLHRLELIFENSSGKTVRVSAGNLYWRGWRRLEIPLPPTLFKRGSVTERFYRHQFKGFRIISHPLAQPGDVALLFDNLLILSDESEYRYPGNEYSDSW